MSNDAATVAWLNFMNVEVNRYLPLPFLILGTIGLTLNILIFTRRNLFRNSCIQYLLCNTVSNYIVLYWVIFTRILSDGYGNDLSLRSDLFCRIRYFLTYYSRTLSTWSIVLACVDRWFSSIQAKNRFNNVRLARIIVLVASIVCFVSYFHVLFLFGVQINPKSLSATCYAQTGIYRLLSDIQYLVFYALGPPLLMLGFGLLTLRNVQKNRRIVSTSIQTANSQSQRRRETQILIMLLLQILVIIIFTLPFAIQKLVDTFVLQTNQTAVEKARYSLLSGTLRLISYGSHTLSFYFYTLAAKIFRVELWGLVNGFYRFIFKKNLRTVRPSNGTTALTFGRQEATNAIGTVDTAQQYQMDPLK